MQVVMKPYAVPQLNHMEVTSLVATSVTLYLAAFYAVPYDFGGGFLVLVTVLMLTINGAVLLYFALAIMRAGTTAVLKQIGAMPAEEEKVRSSCSAVLVLYHASNMLSVQLSWLMLRP